MSLKRLAHRLDPINTDDRRALTEFGIGGNWKVCKCIEITEHCTVGGHYHKNKEESFLLLKGSGEISLGANEMTVEAPFLVNVPRNIYHSFRLEKGSILIGLASEEHDPNDDYKI